jgi:light-regulated signal transduction histidine kinase (bacteriophytochrome)
MVTAANVDLSNCDRELVHMPDLIQPHGAMLVLRPDDLVIRQASENTASLFGVAAEALPMGGLEALLGPKHAARIRREIARAGDRLDGGPLYILPEIPADEGRAGFHVMAHRAGDALILELERMSGARPRLEALYAELAVSSDRLQSATTLNAFFDSAVADARALTSFDRVMAYQFAEDGSGEVIAEARRDDLESYLGHHFPASDIPAPARRLFALSGLRHLPDVNYGPVPLSPPANAPVDMSRAMLRHVSAMYSTYLKNIGAHATLVMPLLKAGRLWGLMSCMHHSGPLHVPCETRTAVELFGSMVSLRMAAQEDRETAAYRERMSRASAAITTEIERNSDYHLGLKAAAPLLHGWMEATGAALALDHSLDLLGETPTKDQVSALVAWLDAYMGDRTEFATDRLAALYPPAGALQATAAGLLAARLMYGRSGFMMWFRPAIEQTVMWAGDPHKPVQEHEVDGRTHLTPRSSFAAWRETVADRGAPWKTWEIQAAKDLRQSIGAVALARMNEDLRRSNTELDSFAYAASHDLKEPLRGINNFVTFLERSAETKLTNEELGRIETIKRLAKRMDGLTDALLQYSRVGQTELSLNPVDLSELLREVIQELQPMITRKGVEVRTPRALPTIQSDRTWLMEVFTNLIANAIKYNDRPPGERWVEVTWRVTDGRLVISIRDNGIGIAQRHLEDVFRIFRRLHARDQYDGGNGAGLTVARRTVERLGGKLWVESEGPGKGSTFLFTLGAAPAEGTPS